MQIYIDGVFYPEADAKISVFDHGLLYGDGVFEGIRFYNGKVFRLKEHVDRIYKSAATILLRIPLDPCTITEAILETIRRNALHEGYIRLVVTRGKGNLGLSPEHCPQGTIIIIATKMAIYPSESYDLGLKVITCASRRVTHGALSPMVKSLNYLNNIMGKIEANHANAGEGLMLNEQGFVAECTGDNIFIVSNGVISTPPISSGALAGVTRAVAIELAQEMELKVSEPQMTRYDIYTANECFLTGTAAEIIPVVELDKRPIGDGKPGKITKNMMQWFRALTQREGTTIY